MHVQAGCVLTADVVLAARPDGPPCPVAITDRGNGTHELSFMSTVVRQPVPNARSAARHAKCQAES